MTTAEIDILEHGLQFIRDLPDRPATAWPNIKDAGIPPVPVNDDDPCLWWRVSWFPNTGQDDFWDDGPVRRRGFFQIAVYCRVDFGIAANKEAQRVVGLVPKGTPLAGVSVHRQPWMAPLIEDDDWCLVPVTIPYDGIVY